MSLYRGLVYRALNPVYAREPLSGEGAARHGGRFNPKGTPALYTSLSPHTAIRESNQVGTLQPTTLVAYRAEIAPVFDTADPAALAERNIAPGTLADPAWRERMLNGQEVPTHELARALMAQGFAGLIVPSYAKGAAADALNLVLWRWNDQPGRTLHLVDDEQRLSGEPCEP